MYVLFFLSTDLLLMLRGVPQFTPFYDYVYASMLQMLTVYYMGTRKNRDRAPGVS